MQTGIRQVALGFLVVLAFKPAPAATPEASPGADIGWDLKTLLEEVVADPDIPGALLAVPAPGLGLEWQGAAGVSARDDNAAMSPCAPLRIASNTKTFVAVTTLRLWEEGVLDLDALMAGYLTPEQARILRDDGYDLEAITLRHLLTHTSGLVDHGAQGEYLQAILADPQRDWTREDQIRGATVWGEPLGSPGTSFSYSDTGYILLGQVIEKATGTTLAAAVRQQVGFARLGLDSTWWERIESKPAAACQRAHQYLGAHDTHGWNPSLDLHGGGGLVTTMADLARFWYSLFAGKVFARTSTLQTLLTTPVEAVVDGYRMGVFEREFGGLTVYGHSGFWGTRAIYVPDLDLALAAAVTQQETSHRVFQLVEDAGARIRSHVAQEEVK